MALLNIYVVFDAKSQSFSLPHFSVNNDTAVREMIQAARDPAHAFGMWPGDFALYHLGWYDQETAEYSIHPQRAQVFGVGALPFLLSGANRALEETNAGANRAQE